MTHSAMQNDEKKWNEWLAGLIDGDGSLLISSSGYASCEITMDLRDEFALQQVKKKLGGSVKLRSGSKSIRYRLHHKQGILELIDRINGQLRNSIRQAQFKKWCSKYSIPYKEPILRPSKENAWFGGFFDADGTITIGFKNKYPELTISVSNKKAENILVYKEVFSGNIYYDKSSRTYKWSIQRKLDNLNFLQHLKENGSCYSSQKFRLFLIPRFYELLELKAYKADDNSLLYKAWLKFMEKWQSRCL